MRKAKHYENESMRNDEWLTPPGIIQSLGKFDLDPCAPITRPWDMATNHYTILDNGLQKEWAGRVWLNPPYGRDIGRWLNKMQGHGNGISLIFARTDADYWHKYIFGKATGIFFFKGRIKFFTVEGRVAGSSAAASSVLISYGKDNAKILSACRLLGHFINL